MNYVLIIGRLTRDVEIRQAGDSVAANFTVAIDRPTRDGAEKQADFPRVTVWGKQAENLDRYMSKGRQVIVFGRITTGKYEKNGQTHYTTGVTAERIEYAGGTNTNNQGSIAPGPGFKAADCASGQPVEMDMQDFPSTFTATDDDVPF